MPSLTHIGLSQGRVKGADQVAECLGIHALDTSLLGAAALTAQHHKFAVIDNKTVITGSFNWSPSAAHINDETLLVIHSPQLAKHFTREMDRLWGSAELGITPHIQRKLERQKIRCGDGATRR